MIFKTALLLLFIMETASAASKKKTYIIHVDKSKISSDLFAGNSKEWYEAVIDSISRLSAKEENKPEPTAPELLYVYKTAISGFAAKLSSRQLESLSKVNGFLFATPDEMLSLHTTHSPQFLGLESGKGLWDAPSLASEVIIGLVDSGIWPEHVSFQDTGMSPVPYKWKGVCEQGTNFSASNCNKKIIGARAFFKGYEAVAGKINETENYRSARDSAGHGTHTASTAAGNLVKNASLFGFAQGSAGGMRYKSRIAAYKVCWPSGCASSDILAAIDQAIADGVDVLSLSLGGAARPYYNDNIAIGAFRAIQNGIFVSCSAGNSGPYSSSVTNGAPWIMTVAASYLDRSFPTTVKLGDGQNFTGSALYNGKPTKQLPIVYGKSAGDEEDAKYCIEDALNPKLVKGKVVLCQRGGSSRVDKAEQVRLAGGAGMIVINDEDEGEELFAEPYTLPATSLGASADKAIKKYLNSNKNPTASIAFKGTVYGNPAPVMAAFSSRGPNSVGPDLLKPDITAPGVNILAAWPPMTSPTELEGDKKSVVFNIISGTSMSCPHVSGVAALIKSVHSDWSPAAIKSALMTSAYTLDNKNGPIADVAYSSPTSATPFAFGSGHVDPQSASDPGLVYDVTVQDYQTYLCSLNYTSSQLAVFLGKDFACPKTGKLQPGDLNYPSFAVNFKAKNIKNTVAYRRTVTNVGSPSSIYQVKVEEPQAVSVVVEPKVLKFQKLGETLSYKVTFVGLGKNKTSAGSAFGSLAWASGKYTVRSPIALTWM